MTRRDSFVEGVLIINHDIFHFIITKIWSAKYKFAMDGFLGISSGELTDIVVSKNH